MARLRSHHRHPRPTRPLRPSKGADFLHAYVLGTLALDHRGEALYDARAQRELGATRTRLSRRLLPARLRPPIR